MRDDVLESLLQYARTGRPLGGFLTAVVEHDLFESFARADDDNRADMYQIVRFVFNELPSNCHGSKKKVDAFYTWIRKPEHRQEVADFLARRRDHRITEYGGTG